MRLIINSTGEEVVPGNTYRIVRGVLAKSREESTLTVSKVVAPTSDNAGLGLLITSVDNSGGLQSRREYYPSVIGASWVD